jgi:hypothetical protein
MTALTMASTDDEHVADPIAMPCSERARARDAAEPWLGQGPRIPDANVREILAVAERARKLVGPDVDVPDPATIHLGSAEAALTAASDRLAEVLRGRREALAHTGSGDGIEVLLELIDIRDRLREARSVQRAAAPKFWPDVAGHATNVISLGREPARDRRAAARLARSVISQAKSGGRLAMKARMPSAASPSTNSPCSNSAS